MDNVNGVWHLMSEIKPDVGDLIFYIDRSLGVHLGTTTRERVLNYGYTDQFLNFDEVLYWTPVVLPPPPIGRYKLEGVVTWSEA